MGFEIERKFLVRDTTVLRSRAGTRMRQGYLVRSGPGAPFTVRVRIAPPRAWLTLKSDTRGIARDEFEYEVPVADAEALLAQSPWPVLEKTRHLVPVGAHTYEVDVFHGALAPLVVAEIELASEHEAFERPDWLGDEVTHDPSYRNSELVLRLLRGAT